MSRSKADLRRAALSARESLPPDEMAGPAIARHFLAEFGDALPAAVALYASKDNEIDTSLLLQALQARYCPCALPVIGAGRILSFAAWRDGDPLVPGRFAILQPAITPETVWLVPDIVVLPLLAFDRHGRRLGYGGGYYDATMADLRRRNTVVAVGLGHDSQYTSDDLPLEEHDILLDIVLTPSGVRHFEHGGAGHRIY